MKKSNDLTKQIAEDLEEGKGKVHTKTEKELVEDAQALERKKKQAFVGAVMLLSATYTKLQELQDLGATKMATKNHVNRTIESMERDLNGVFDIVDEKKGETTVSGYVDRGVRGLEEKLADYLKDMP